MPVARAVPAVGHGDPAAVELGVGGAGVRAEPGGAGARSAVGRPEIVALFEKRSCVNEIEKASLSYDAEPQVEHSHGVCGGGGGGGGGQLLVRCAKAAPLQ